jgi:hypothetical protein
MSWNSLDSPFIQINWAIKFNEGSFFECFEVEDHFFALRLNEMHWDYKLALRQIAQARLLLELVFLIIFQSLPIFFALVR